MVSVEPLEIIQNQFIFIICVADDITLNKRRVDRLFVFILYIDV